MYVSTKVKRVSFLMHGSWDIYGHDILTIARYVGIIFESDVHNWMTSETVSHNDPLAYLLIIEQYEYDCISLNYSVSDYVMC